jgi:hypothetical protein
MPQTINAANIATLSPLVRATVEGHARTTAVHLTLSSRPVGWASGTVRFRTYDYDNRPPEFALVERVAYDNAPSALASAAETEPFSLFRRDLDAEVQVTPHSLASMSVGLSRLEEDRTHRLFDGTTENVVRLMFDSVGSQQLILRARYEHGRKRGETLEIGLLQAAGEQPGMRHFDVASRDRDRVTLLASLVPLSSVALNASIAVGKDDYVESLFGLRDNTHRVYTAGIDVAPAANLFFAPSYSYERYGALSRSRQANPGREFDDPSRNWAADSTDRVHSFLLTGGMSGMFDRIDIDVSYDYNDARSIHRYVTGAVANRTLPEEVVVETTLPPPTQLPPTRSRMHRGTLDVLYRLTGRLSAGVSYWHEDFDIDDFTLDADRNPDLVRGQVLLLGYLYRPYAARTVWSRLVFQW